MAEVPRKRATVCLTGMYSRWDILSLNVRDAPFEPVYHLEDRELKYRDGDSEHIRILEQKIEELERRLETEGELARVKDAAKRKDSKVT